MKLHLPQALRSVLLACSCGLAAIGSTLSSGTLMSSVLVAGAVLQAEAGVIDVSGSHTVTGNLTNDELNLIAGDHTITVEDGGNYEVGWIDNSDTNGATYTKDGGGSLTVLNAPGQRRPTSITVADGVLTLAYQEYGVTPAEELIKILGDGKLVITKQNGLGTDKGSDGDHTLPLLTMKGDSATAVATLQLDQSNQYRHEIQLQGHTQITGEGALDIQGTAAVINVSGVNNTISTEINLTGSLAINNTGSLVLGGVVSGDGALTLNNGGSLTIDANVSAKNYSLSSAGSIKVKNGATLSITSFTDGLGKKVWNLLENIEVSEGYNGLVKIAGNVSTADGFDGDTKTENVISGRIQIDGTLNINAWANNTGYAMTTKIADGAYLKVQNLNMWSYQTMEVNGELNVSDGIIRLGNPDNSYAGHLKIGGSSAQVSAKGITFALDAPSSVEMTSGKLILGSGGIAAHDEATAVPSISFSGGTLSASADWTTSYGMTLGSADANTPFTIDSGSYSIELNGSNTIDGAVKTKGDVTLSSLTLDDGDSFTAEGKLTVNGAITVTGGQFILDKASVLAGHSGAVAVSGSGTFKLLNGGWKDTDSVNLQMNDGTLNLNDKTLVGSLVLDAAAASTVTDITGGGAFRGNVSGKGSLSFAKANSTYYLYKAWDGAENKAEGDITLTHEGSFTVQSGATVALGHTNTGENINSGAKLQNKGDVEVAGTLQATSGSSIANNGNVTVTGTLKIEGSSSLNLSGADAGKGKVTVKSGATISIDSGATFSAKELILSGGSVTSSVYLTLEKLTVASGTHDLESFGFTGLGDNGKTAVSVAAGAAIENVAGAIANIKSLEFAGGAKLILGSGALDFSAVESIVFRADPKTEATGAAMTMAFDPELDVDESIVNYSYATIDVSGYANNSSLLATDSTQTALFTGVDSAAWTGENERVWITFGDDHIDNGLYNLALNEAGNVFIASRVVPEPATATLSLLALTALAARRRRK